MRRSMPLLAALGAVALVLVPYVSLGGGSYEPTSVADPCVTREWRDPGDVSAVLEQVLLSALDGAACALGVSREDIVLAVSDEESLEEFADAQGISRTDAERAIEDGFERAVDDAREAGALSGLASSLVARTLETLPPWLVLDALERLLAFLP